MALDKSKLKKSISDGFYEIFKEQSSKAVSGDEKEDPDVVIKRIASSMATVVSDAVNEFVKSGDIYVGKENIVVISSAPGTAAVVTKSLPTKME